MFVSRVFSRNSRRITPLLLASNGARHQARRNAGTFTSPTPAGYSFTVPIGFALGGLGVGALAYETFASMTDTPTDFEQVKKDVLAIMENENYEDGSYGPLLVRLAWHASGSYNRHDNTGGSGGCTMNHSPEKDYGANAGLGVARDLLEPIKKKYPNLSYADLWTLAGALAIEEMGGPAVNWRPGRSDAPKKKATPDGRLPDASKESTHLRTIFYRMGFTDREIVALSGAHCLGRCHTNRSGYTGPWTRSPTSFTNAYFVELTTNKWTKKNWNGPEQYTDPTGELMMLPADMALLKDPSFKEYVDRYAKDEELFFKDFAEAFGKLMELGVDFQKKERYFPHLSKALEPILNRN